MKADLSDLKQAPNFLGMPERSSFPGRFSFVEGRGTNQPNIAFPSRNGHEGTADFPESRTITQPVVKYRDRTKSYRVVRAELEKMNPSERRLYHQVHPAKLFTDISTSIVTLYLFWIHNLIPAVLLHILPSIIISYIIIRFANLDKYPESRLGRYLANYMTTSMQLLRLLGDLITVLGAWFQMLYVIGLGLIIILLGWTRGLLTP